MAPVPSGGATRQAGARNTTTMDTKTIAMAALAALCLLPAASANTPGDPWGPDVSATVTTNACDLGGSGVDLEDTLDSLPGPGVDTQTDVHTSDCDAYAAYDANNVEATCDPFSSPAVGVRVVLHRDCDVDVLA